MFTGAGEITSSQTICLGDPVATLVETAPPTIAGPWEYLWMQSIPSDPILNTWNAIPGATGIDYTPPSPSVTTLYTRCVRLLGSSDNFVETNVVTITVVDNSIATIAAAPGAGNVGDLLSFSAITSPNSTYSWDFGDGTTPSTGQSAIHIFGSNSNITNTYTVTLTVTNSNNCVQTATITVTITDIGLPIELLYFDANDNEHGEVVLNWATASEKDNEYFDLERSTDGLNFRSICKVAGAINSTNILQYSYRDEAPKDGNNYYRLKQVDTNGDFEYSEIVLVQFNDKTTGFSFFPNPVKSEMNVKFGTPLSKNSTLEIYNIKGQIVGNFDLKNNIQSGITINLEDYDNGTYIVIIKDKNENIFMEKILKID